MEKTWVNQEILRPAPCHLPPPKGHHVTVMASRVQWSRAFMFDIRHGWKSRHQYKVTTHDLVIKVAANYCYERFVYIRRGAVACDVNAGKEEFLHSE